MNILVIGSKGFIGSNCVKHLSLAGNNVIGCDVLELEEPNYVSLDSVGGDFNKIFEKTKFDFCINAAGSAHVSYSFQYPEKDFELNVFLVINLLSAIKKHSPLCRLVNFSSAAVYGNPAKLPIEENSPTVPLSPYGYHKLLSENLLLEYTRFFNLRTCSLRVFSAFGEGLKKQLFWDLYQKSLLKDEIVLYGTGNETRDFIYIRDLINIVALIIEKGQFEGEIYNIGNGEEITIRDASNTFFNEMNYKKSIVFSGEEKLGDPINWKASIRKIQQLGYKQQYPFKKGMQYYCEWLNSLDK